MANRFLYTVEFDASKEIWLPKKVDTLIDDQLTPWETEEAAQEYCDAINRVFGSQRTLKKV